MSLSLSRAALADTLAAAGHPLLDLSAPGQGTLLVLPHGGRVLGLYAEGVEENFLWVNPAMATAEGTRAFLAGTPSPHTGGDRIWVSPEIETHIPDASDPWGTYAPPPPVDPGHYTATRRGQCIELRNRARVRFYRSQVDCDLEIERSLRLIANPLRHDPELAGVAYAGYEQVSTVRLDDPATAPALSLWSLLVIPPAGWMIIPTWGQAEVTDFFEPTAPERLLRTPHAVHFRIDGLEQHKIGVRPGALMGRAGYLRTTAPDTHTLVVRNWHNDPSGDYMDTRWEVRAEPGHAFESYNGGQVLGQFGELEYHTPALGGGRSADSLTDTSQLWAYSGAPDAIAAIGRRLLGADSMPAA